MLKERKKVELEDLALMVKKGFDEVRSELLGVRFDLSKKSDKTDIVLLKTDIGSLQNDINRLAVATKLGFDEVHNRFKKVDGEFGKMKVEFEKIDDRFAGVENKLVNLDRRLDIFVTHEKRLVKVERELGFAV